MKQKKMDIYYDAESDYLEIAMGDPRVGAFRGVGRDIFERVDKKTGNVLGVAIFNFRKRTEKLKPVSIPLRIQMWLYDVFQPTCLEYV